jgi:hypothetical protein
LGFAVGTILGLVGIHAASNLIIGVSATAAARMQLMVGCGFEILQNSYAAVRSLGKEWKWSQQSAVTVIVILG